MGEQEQNGRRPELFVGLVGAVGTDLGSVREHLEKYLYQARYSCHRIRLSQLLHGIKGSPWESLEGEVTEERRIESHMDAGDALRHKLKRGDALAGLAVSAIREFRESKNGDGDIVVPGTAYIIDSLKHLEEVETLRDAYGPVFVLVSAYCPREARIERLAKQIAGSHDDPDASKFMEQAQHLARKDEHEPDNVYGQNVRDTFPQADVFVDASEKATLADSIRRAIEMLFGHPFHTPTRHEYGMYLANAAARRSADLSRQVGAAIATAEGDIVAVGTNEVPRAGGGLYWSDDTDDHRDFQRGEDTSSIRKSYMLKDVLKRLKGRGWLAEELCRKSIDELYDICGPSMAEAQIMQVSEFGRSVHAEMAAIVDAARRGVSVEGCTLYSTAFPCHGCAKHIVAAGIRKVFYIEPYPKSQAEELHNDAISIDGRSAKCGDPVAFLPFVGVAPRRYMDWFGMPAKRKDEAGDPIQWDFRQARAIWDRDTPMVAYIEEEKVLTKRIVDQLKEGGLQDA